MSQRSQQEPLSPLRYPSLHKAASDRPKAKDEPSGPRSQKEIPEVITYLLMKEKFDKLYRNIEKISQAETPTRKERETHSESPSPSIKVIHLTERKTEPEICKVRTSQLYPKRSMAEENLEINTVSEMERVRKKSSVANKQPSTLMYKSHNRRKLLESLPKSKMSNNVKDYLSVERISIREMEDSLIQKSKMVRQYHLSNLLGCQQDSPDQDASLHTYHSADIRPEQALEQVKPKQLILRRANTKFKPPFELYHYRDFIWKVAFSNNFLVEAVEDYDSRPKAYVGPGNNSNLIKGLLRRRPWWLLTDKVQEASFVWTQIKVGAIFSSQKKGERLPAILDEVSLTKGNSASANPLLNCSEQTRWEQYWRSNLETERRVKESLRGRSKAMGLSEVGMARVRAEVRIHNHFPNNFIIGNKKALFQTMTQYYGKVGREVFDCLPLTFHIKKGLEDDEYLKFLQRFYGIGKAAKGDPNHEHRHNAWIVKPGENTNRGNGIIVCLELADIKAILKRQEKHADGSLKTYILQKYIERPLLYKKRKFDLRHYLMLSCSNGRMKGYWYQEGYVRTTSSEYTLKQSTGGVHLTNDAVQKYLPDYGKFEKGNKIFYHELNAYVKKQDPNFDFFTQVFPRMKAIATDVIHASACNIDPQRRTNNFEVFGLDFMIDADYNVWLIEVNTNPCLETTCPVLNKIIPRFIENTFQICLDPVFGAPLGFRPKYEKYLEKIQDENLFELVFDERIDGAQSIGETLVADGVEEDDDVFEDDGEDFEQPI